MYVSVLFSYMLSIHTLWCVCVCVCTHVCACVLVPGAGSNKMFDPLDLKLYFAIWYWELVQRCHLGTGN